MSCFALMVTACGGGGGGGSSSGETTSGTNTPSSTPSSSPTQSAGAARQISLAWTIPTTRADGSPLAASEISAYRLFYTREGSTESEDTIVVINSGSATNTSLSLALAGTYTFAITAVDISGMESGLSAPVSVAVY